MVLGVTAAGSRRRAASMLLLAGHLSIPGLASAQERFIVMLIGSLG